MNKISLNIMWLLLIVTIYAYGDNNFVIILENNSTHYIFEDKVNIRKEPNLNANIINQAKIGESIQIIERSDIKQELYGLMAYWYKIDYNNKIGYLWGGLISSIEIIVDFDHDKKDEILMSRCTTNGEHGFAEYMVKYSHEYRLCRKGELLSDNPFIKKPTESNFGFEKLTNLGFEPNIVLLNVMWGFGDAGFGSLKNEIYYLKGNRFYLVYEYEEETTPDEVEKYKIKYPKESKKNNVMVIEKRKIKYIPNTNKELSNEVLDRIELIWNGVDFQRLDK